MPRVKIGPALPDREKLDVEIARLRDLDRWSASQPLAYRIRPASARSACCHLLFRSLARTGCRPTVLGTLTWRVSV